MTSRRRLAAAGLALAGAGWLVAALLLWRTEVPGGLDLDGLDPRRYFTADEIEEAAGYEEGTSWILLSSTVVVLLVLAGYARWGARLTRESAAGPIGTGMLLGMLGLGILWFAEVPFTVLGVWWDRRHDVGEIGYLEAVFGDWLLLGSAFLSISFSLAVVIGLARKLGDRWWLPGAAVFVAVGLLFAFATPYLLGGALHPLSDPELAADARRLAREQGVPEIRLREETVSSWTSAPNAYAAGLGPSRIVVLWDTLLLGFDRPEVLVVLAHELAHHSRDHIWKGIGWYALFAFPGTFLLARATRRRGGMAVPEAVPLALFLFVALQLVTTPLSNEVSRRFEAEADWLALETTRDPDAARRLFEGFTEEALAHPSPPTWSYLLVDTHPTVMQRIAMTEAWRARRR